VLVETTAYQSWRVFIETRCSLTLIRHINTSRGASTDAWLRWSYTMTASV